MASAFSILRFWISWINDSHLVTIWPSAEYLTKKKFELGSENI